MKFHRTTASIVVVAVVSLGGRRVEGQNCENDLDLCYFGEGEEPCQVCLEQVADAVADVPCDSLATEACPLIEACRTTFPDVSGCYVDCEEGVESDLVLCVVNEGKPPASQCPSLDCSAQGPAPTTPGPTPEPTPSPTPAPTPAPAPAPTPAPITPDPTPAPVTPAPVTDQTPAPATPAPMTDATPAPVTPAPVTDLTPAPVTPAPVTDPTPAPVTPAPVTDPTPAPVTPAPTTEVTPAPVTPAPVTPEPTVECPLFSCCEDDCCGEGTKWDAATSYCVIDPDSPGYVGIHYEGWDPGCADRDCCGADCCSDGMRYDQVVAFCVPDEPNR